MRTHFNILAYCLALIPDKENQNKFEQLFYKYEREMLAYAKRIVRDDYLAEDIFSKALEDIARNMNSIGEVDSSETRNYVLKAIKNTSINFSKKEQKHYSRYVSYDDPDMELQVDKASFKAAESYDDIKAEILADAIQKLPEKYRQVILYRYADGLSSKEIAARLDYTVANVDQIMRRAKKELAKMVKDVKIDEI